MQEINQKITFSTTGDVDYEKVRTGQIPKEILSEVFDNILEHYEVPKENCRELGVTINEIDPPEFMEYDEDERFFELLIKLIFTKREEEEYDVNQTFNETYSKIQFYKIYLNNKLIAK